MTDSDNHTGPLGSVIRAFYDARRTASRAGDLSPLGRFLAPDVRWREPDVGGRVRELRPWRHDPGSRIGRQSKAMRSILTIACIALSAVVLAWPAQADVSGRPQVIDGDSLKIGGTRIRLFGIDAPERGQGCQAEGKLWLCGGFAKMMLERRIAGRTVVCEKKDQDRYGRVVAVCRVNGEDLNAWMVSEGWAIAYRRYSQDYVGEEADAKSARRGLWRGEFVPPWDWRRGKRLPTAAQNSGGATELNRSGGDCLIKGNISSKGTRIYHVPGGRYYERTRIDTSKGERWFCSEAEARKAGWRRSRR